MRSISKDAFRRYAAEAEARGRYRGGGRQMRSIFRMPSDDVAGDAKRRVPIPIKKGETE